MSPELLDRYADIKDVQSFISIDIYALSLVLWEVLNRTAIDSSFKPGTKFEFYEIFKKFLPVIQNINHHMPIL